MSAAPTVSVIVSTLNRADQLAACLGALEGLDYPAFEIIVVAGPCTDDTPAVLARWGGRIKALGCAEANLSVSRNVGIAAAAGDIIAFIDDDAAPHPKWLARLADAFADPRVGAAGGFTVDNTGVAWQVRKTLCDRFGNAHNVSAYFDERPFCRPGAAYYPSLLGTNAAFRAEALRGVGGFDPAFAYLLDETDVCLRLVDAGWRVAYEPQALVFHQFAASHIRDASRVARTLYPSAVSKGYFLMRHGAAASLARAGQELERYRTEILEANRGLLEVGAVSAEHAFSLDQDLMRGLEDGMALARERAGGPSGGLTSADRPGDFLPLDRPDGPRIAFVSQGFPPANEGGIARWTAMAARGLAERGFKVHVLTRAAEAETVTFEDGLWIHRLLPEAEAGEVAEAYDVPSDIAAWSARVWREAQALKGFGLDLVSFPIWDLEALPLLDDPDLPAVISLHTTYAMAKPFKPEWNLRPIFERRHVDRMIAAEGRALGRAPLLLANSEAVMDEIWRLYGVDVRPRARLAPHGVLDPLTGRAERAAARDAQADAGAPLRVLAVGRFEARKGFDLAAAAAAALVGGGADIEVWFAGGALDAATRSVLREVGAGGLETEPRVRFLGDLGRAALEDAYADCDLVLAPSRWESFGLVAAESMAAGRPVIALATGGTVEIVEDGVTGRLVGDDADAAAGLAAAVAALDADRTGLRRLARAARAAYEARFTAAAMAAALDPIYRAAVARRREAAA